MRTVFFLISILLIGSEAMAQNEGVTKALETKLEGQVFKASLKTGYHFNEKAPNLLKVDDKRILPSELKRQSMTFKLPTKTYSSAQASIYICDDENTFCEPRHIPVKGEAGAEASAAKKTSKLRPNHHGFLEATLDDAKRIADKEKKLILVDFSARWCPGCVRLEQEVFETKSFKDISKNFIKLKLDVDRFENSAAKKSHAVSAIPTLLVLNGDLKEISRIVDYQPIAIVENFLRAAQATPYTFEELQAKADNGDSSAALLLGQRFYNADQFSEAVTYLSKVSPQPIELRDAKVRAAEKASKDSSEAKAAFHNVARAMIVEEPNSSRSIVWRTRLAESLPEGDPQRKALATEGLAVADKILANEKDLSSAMAGDFIGEFAGYEKLLVAFNRADLAAAGELGDEAVKAANVRVGEIAKQLKIPISKTGPSMRYLLALVGANDFVAAEEQARKLLQRDSKNPELQRRLLRVLNENKKFAEAIKVGNRALAGSYGRNEVWVVQQLAKSYVGNNQSLEASALIRAYLERADIDWSALESEKKDLTSQLEALQKRSST